MRVLLSTIGSRGDVQPLVGLALALRERGHESRLCVPPDFREWIDGLGFQVTPIGPELRTFTMPKPAANAPPMSPEQRRQLAEASVATQFQTVAAAAEGCDAIVAATALQIAARSVAERNGLPYVFAAYCPIVLPSPHHAPPPLPVIPGLAPPAPPATNEEAWGRDAARFNDLFGGALNAHRKTLGLPPVEDVRSHVFGDRPFLAADPTLAPWPDLADESVVQTGAWLVRDDRPLGPEIETFLDAGDPPIYFGFGSMRVAGGLGDVALQAARAVGRRAIVSRGWADLAVEVAPDCLAIGEVNQQALFARCGAVVHHGGAGTTTTAALSGVPQVVVPQMYDQHYFASRVRDLGLGTAHSPGLPTVESLTEALATGIAPLIPNRAGEVGRAVLKDGAPAAAREVLVRLPLLSS